MEICEFLESFHTFQCNKSSQQKQCGLLQPLAILKGPWMSLSLDQISQIPPPSSSSDAKILSLDRFFQMTLFIKTVTTKTTKDFKNFFLEFIFMKDGPPTDFLRNIGSCF